MRLAPGAPGFAVAAAGQGPAALCVWGYWARGCGVGSFTGVICGACRAVEELAARDTLIASLREENEALRV